MKIAILSARQGWHTDELCRALASRGHESWVLPYEADSVRLGREPGVRNGDVRLDRMDRIIARIIPNGSLEQVVFRLDTLHRLEDRGIRVVNSPGAIERTVDKCWTSSLLEQAGLPTPETVVCERSEDALAAFRAMGDVIVKPLFGSMGLGMVRVSEEETAFRVFRAIELVRGVFYLQRTIEHGGRDYRVFVIGGRVIGAIERSAPGWRTNIARGGQARAFDPPEQIRHLATEAARVVGTEYAGVDVLPASDGTPYVLEVNGIPGWKGLHEATGKDIAGAIVDQVVG